MLGGQAMSLRRRVPDAMANTAAFLTREAALKLTGHEPTGALLHHARSTDRPLQPPLIAIEDWDALFCAVQTQLKHAVGEQLGVLPYTPKHSTELAAALVQAIVLDCVGAMDQLHAALKLERNQRPTT
ncbi:hypothetical protein B0B52_05155 [Polaromonas sp. A23]|nr:hypothetical protein B0B52_05155 [Polaromonas sp. A23]